MTVIQFKLRPAEVDVDDLTIAIFAALADCRGVDCDEVAAKFITQHPRIRSVDVTSAVAFGFRVLSCFERTILVHIATDGDAACPVPFHLKTYVAPTPVMSGGNALFNIFMKPDRDLFLKH